MGLHLHVSWSLWLWVPPLLDEGAAPSSDGKGNPPPPVRGGPSLLLMFVARTALFSVRVTLDAVYVVMIARFTAKWP